MGILDSQAEGFNPKKDYLIRTWRTVRDENGNILPQLKRDEEVKIYSEDAYEAGFASYVNRQTKQESIPSMKRLGYEWEILSKPSK